MVLSPYLTIFTATYTQIWLSLASLKCCNAIEFRLTREVRNREMSTHGKAMAGVEQNRAIMDMEAKKDMLVLVIEIKLDSIRGRWSERKFPKSDRKE